MRSEGKDTISCLQ